MAYRRCPSCGHSYNGKRCKNCLYEPFGEVRPSYELHQAAPEPRQKTAPKQEVYPSRPGPIRTPYAGNRKKKYSPGKTILKRLGTVWAVILLLTGLMPILFEMIDDVGSSFVTAVPETVPLPANGIVIYEDADIQITADWDGAPIEGDIPIFVQNFTGKDLIVSTDGVAINGCMVTEVFFYCNAYRNSVSTATLWIDMDALSAMGIQKGQHIRMSVDVTDEDYTMLTENILVELGSKYMQPLDDSGQVLYDQDGFRLIYAGTDEDPFGDPRLIFYAENNTGRFMELSANELLINGEESGCWLWQNFFPETKGIFYGRIHDFAIPGENALAEVDLFLTPDGDWNQEIYIGPVNFPINGT